MNDTLIDYILDHPRIAAVLALLALAAAFVAKVSTVASIFCVIAAALLIVTFVDGTAKKKNLSKRWRLAAYLGTAIVLTAYCVWLLVPKAADLDFEYIFVHIGVTNTWPKDTFINVIGKVNNNGEIPARIQDWKLTAQLEGEPVALDSQILNNSYIWNMTFNTPGGRTVLPAQKAYLPDITATDPIVQNGSKVGFIVFRIPNVDWRTTFMRRKATLVLSFADSNGKVFSKDFMWVPSENTPPPGHIPGMPGPEPGPPPTK